MTTVTVFLGSVVGSIVTFFLGRYFLREWVLATAERNGLLVMTLLRLSPIVPYNVLGYLAGAATVTLPAYTMSLVAILPGTALFSYVGATASSLLDSCQKAEGGAVPHVVTAAGILFGVAAVAVTGHCTKQELRKVRRGRAGGGAPPRARCSRPRPSPLTSSRRTKRRRGRHE